MKKSLLQIFLFLITVPIYSATLQVPSAYPTIQDAILAANNLDDTVLVGPGTYVENINFFKRAIVLMSSDGPENTILMPQFPDSPLVRMDAEVFGATQTNQNLIGFTCMGQEEGIVVYVESDPFKSTEISNNIFYGNIHYPNYDTVTEAYVIKVVNTFAHIKNNRFYNNGGLACIYAWNDFIYNNVFDSNRVAIEERSASDHSILNNIFSNSLVADIIYNGSHFIDFNNFWNSPIIPTFGTPLPGTSNISVNPYYIDQANKDFRLQSNSLCINHGLPYPILSEFGGTIFPVYNDPDGSRNDIGAFPYVPEVYPTPVEIFIEGKSMDAVIRTLTPEFSWSYNDTGLTNQTDFQIQIGLDADWTTVEIWDSGPIADNSSSYLYDGPALSDLTEFYIRIRLNNGSQWGDWLQSIFNTRVATFTYYVPDDYSTIQEALSFAWAGDTIYVRPGSYAGVSIDIEAISLIATEGSKNTILTNTKINNVQNGRVTIAGFTIKCQGEWSGPLIDINNCSDVVIENNHLQRIFCSDIDGGSFGITGISIDSSQVRVERNILSNLTQTSYQGIEVLSGSDNTEIINNTIVSTNYGIRIYSDNVTVINNIIYGHANTGIDIDPSVSILNADYNCYWNNSNNYSSVIGQGGNDLLVDPDFLQLEDEIFYISSLSPCRDNGNPDTQYNDPDGSRNDIGALPFGPQPPTSPININATPLYGSSNSFIISKSPTIYWSPSLSSSPFDTIHYQLKLARHSNQDFAEVSYYELIDNIYDTSYTFPEEITYRHFYPYVKAITKDGLTSFNNNPNSFNGWIYGDINISSTVDISDIVYLVDFIFTGGPAIIPPIIGDITGDCAIDISDLVIMVDFVLVGAPYSTIQAGCE